MRQKQDGLGMRQTFSLVCDSELSVSNFCEMCCSSASFCAMMTCNDLSLLSKREILACVWVWGLCVCVWLLCVMVACVCVCVCVRRWGLITAWTYYYDDCGVSGVRIKQTCYKMLQEVTCINNWVHTHTSRFLQWLAALSHSARHCRSFNCMQHTSYHMT